MTNVILVVVLCLFLILLNAYLERNRRGKWMTQTAANGEVHVIPLGDTINHHYNQCRCVPETEAVFTEDGSNGWLVTHNALDGRKQ